MGAKRQILVVYIRALALLHFYFPASRGQYNLLTILLPHHRPEDNNANFQVKFLKPRAKNQSFLPIICQVFSHRNTKLTNTTTNIMLPCDIDMWKKNLLGDCTNGRSIKWFHPRIAQRTKKFTGLLAEAWISAYLQQHGWLKGICINEKPSVLVNSWKLHY